MALPTSPSHFDPASPWLQTRAARSWRWLILLGLSAVLHWLALGHIEVHLGILDTSTPPAALTTEINLLPAPAVPAQPAKPAPSAQPKPRPAPSPVQSQPVAATDVVKTEAVVHDTDELSATEAASDLSTSDDTESPMQFSDTEAAALEEVVQQITSRYAATPPPSVILKYDVEALRKGSMVYGSGKIHWDTDGQTYAIHGEAGVLFFSLLDFESQGIIDEHGVSPVLYTQKRFRKSATNTHFHRERNLISFSASTLSYPRLGGEQDRASLIWQLAAIGYADPAQFFPGGDFSLLVAGVRDLQNWEIKVLTQEEVETGAGKLMAWRVARIPPHGSYEQKLDIWLAPELGWYPVKLRHTDYNGEYLDMILSDFAAPAAN